MYVRAASYRNRRFVDDDNLSFVSRIFVSGPNPFLRTRIFSDGLLWRAYLSRYETRLTIFYRGEKTKKTLMRFLCKTRRAHVGGHVCIRVYLCVICRRRKSCQFFFFSISISPVRYRRRASIASPCHRSKFGVVLL